MSNTNNNSNNSNAQPFDGLIKSRWFPGLIQFVGLLAFLGLSVCGFYGTTEAYRFTNITSFWVWFIWWPGLVLLALLSSRFWCTICPLRLISQWFDKFGLQIKVPKFIRENRIMIIIGFFALHTVIVSFGIHHFSWLTAVYLLSLLGFAFIVAMLFEKDAFCNSFCPLNGFIGIYSKLGTIRLDSIDKSTCKTCKTKDCYHSCPSHLCMGALKDTENCVMCFDCVKQCPNNNIALRTKSPLRALWDTAGTLPLMFIVAILMGIMFEEFGEEWVVVEHAISYVPTTLVSMGLPETIGGYKWLTASWVTFLLPVAIITSTAGVASLFTRRQKILEYSKHYALGLLPLIFSLHLSKMLDALNNKLGYGQFIINDPLGTQTVQQFAAGVLQKPTAIIADPVFGWIIFGIISLGMIGSVIVNGKLGLKFNTPHEGIVSAFTFNITTVLLGMISLIITFNWFGLY